MDQNQMTALDRIEALGNVLDKLGDLPGGGRGKCGLVWVANDVLNDLRNDILVLEETVKTLKGEKEAPAPEVKLEVVKNEEDGNDEETADETDSEEV